MHVTHPTMNNYNSYIIPRNVDIVASPSTTTTFVIVTIVTGWIEHSIIIAMKTDIQHSMLHNDGSTYLNVICLPVVFIEHVLSPIAMVNVPIYYGYPI